MEMESLDGATVSWFLVGDRDSKVTRAVVGRPAVVLADEPTGNLDTATGASLLALLQELNADGTTIVVITHDPTVAAAARRRVEVRDGLVVHDTGPPVVHDAGASA